MKAAAKTQKPKRQKNMPTLSAGVLRCYAAVFSWRWLFLLGRVAWLSKLSPGYAGESGDMRSLRVQQVSTSRGMITDRSGRPLAVSVPVKAI